MTVTAAAKTSKPSKRSSPRAADASPLIPSSFSAAAPATPSSSKPAAHRLLRKPSLAKQPLVPLAEARHYHHERSVSRAGARENDSEKWDANWDNPSAARDGRQFTVSNVGNNGRIYLRYVPLLFRPTLLRKQSRLFLFCKAGRSSCPFKMPTGMHIPVLHVPRNILKLYPRPLLT